MTPCVNPPGNPDPGFKPEVRQLEVFLGRVEATERFLRLSVDQLDAGPKVKGIINGLCPELVGLVYDLRSEVRNLEDKLGLRPGLEPWDPDIKNPDPRVTMDFFRNWAYDSLMVFDEGLKHLDPGSGKETANAQAYLMVANFGTGLWNAYNDMLAALERVEALLQARETTEHN